MFETINIFYSRRDKTILTTQVNITIVQFIYLFCFLTKNSATKLSLLLMLVNEFPFTVFFSPVIFIITNNLD